MSKSLFVALSAAVAVFAGAMPTDAEAHTTRTRAAVKIDKSKVKPVCPPRVKPSRS